VTNNTEDSSSIPLASCSIFQIHPCISTPDRLKFLTVFLALSVIPPARNTRRRSQPLESQTTAGFLSYHSSVVNVPLISPRRNHQITRFAIALRIPNRYRQTQGTSPNFTTAPFPCQIRYALFFFVFCSAPIRLPPNPPQPTPKTWPANSPQVPGHNHSLYHARPIKSNPQSLRKFQLSAPAASTCPYLNTRPSK